MPRVVHFELHAESIDRARRFYENAFGWQGVPWDGPVEYLMLMTGGDSEPGINGAIVARRGPPPVEGQPVNAPVCTISVPVLDIFTGNVVRHGGSIAVPKMTVPGVGYLAYIKDTEGNLLGLMQSDPTAR
jgi:predicted enzyme related to lactoylglutathione lyase